MSARVVALAAVLSKHLGEKAGRRAAPILLDLLINGVVLCELHEIPSALRNDGLLVTIAAELEAAAAGAVRGAVLTHTDQLAAIARPLQYTSPHHARS